MLRFRNLRPALFITSLALFAACAAPEPITKRMQYDRPKDQVFNAALLTLQEWGEDILTVDRAGGTLVTKPRDSEISPDTILNYRLTVFVKEPEPGKSSIEVHAHGEKRTESTGATYQVDENDPNLREIIEGLISSADEKINNK